MKGIQIDRLSVAEENGLFWAVDWVGEGNFTVDRYLLSFKNRRDAESFVRAAKRAVNPT